MNFYSYYFLNAHSLIFLEYDKYVVNNGLKKYGV